MIRKIKVLRTTLLLLSIVSLSGCFKQDYSICPPGERNVRLDFRLIGEDNFTRHINSVDAYIYDAAGTFLRTERIEEAQLDQHQGMFLTLTPGDYRMVFWANMDRNTEVSGHDNGAGEIGLPNNHYNDQGVVTANGDRLWYGPSTPPTRINTRVTRGNPQEHYALSVPRQGEFTDVIHFTPAHRSLEIYVRGLSSQLTVDIEGLPAGLEHMGMQALMGTIVASHATSPVDRDGTSYAATTFDTFHFEDMSGIEIVIRGPDGQEIYRIPLLEAIDQSEADPDKIVIEFMFSFMNGTMEVTIPGWSTTNPGFEI